MIVNYLFGTQISVAFQLCFELIIFFGNIIELIAVVLNQGTEITDTQTFIIITKPEDPTPPSPEPEPEKPNDDPSESDSEWDAYKPPEAWDRLRYLQSKILWPPGDEEKKILAFPV